METAGRMPAMTAIAAVFFILCGKLGNTESVWNEIGWGIQGDCGRITDGIALAKIVTNGDTIVGVGALVPRRGTPGRSDLVLTSHENAETLRNVPNTKLVVDGRTMRFTVRNPTDPVAVLQLRNSVEFSPSFQPGCLPIIEDWQKEKNFARRNKGKASGKVLSGLKNVFSYTSANTIIIDSPKPGAKKELSKRIVSRNSGSYYDYINLISDKVEIIPPGAPFYNSWIVTGADGRSYIWGIYILSMEGYHPVVPYLPTEQIGQHGGGYMSTVEEMEEEEPGVSDSPTLQEDQAVGSYLRRTSEGWASHSPKEQETQTRASRTEQIGQHGGTYLSTVEEKEEPGVSDSPTLQVDQAAGSYLRRTRDGWATQEQEAQTRVSHLPQKQEAQTRVSHLPQKQEAQTRVSHLPKKQEAQTRVSHLHKEQKAQPVARDVPIEEAQPVARDVPIEEAQPVTRDVPIEEAQPVARHLEDGKLKDECCQVM